MLLPPSSLSTRLLPCFIWDYFSQYLIAFVEGDFPVRYLKKKYEALFFFLIEY